MSGPDFVLVPGGGFLMGENAGDKFAGDTERPQHAVTVQPFLLARAPVTIGEFRAFRPAHEPEQPAGWPAVWVSWDDAAAYCGWLGGGCRLPSEAEWEFAARAGAATPYPWGDAVTPAHANYYYAEDGRKTGCGHRTPPGRFPANAFGLLDMPGNVCEWTQDPWHPDYHGAPTDGSARTGSGHPDRRVLRGGAWDYMPRLLRVSWRDSLPQSARRDNVGFRVASDR